MNDTIAAIATAAGRGGVAIIRLSGDPVPIVEKMFFPKGRIPVSRFEGYRLYPGEIDCGSFSDFGLCVLFRAPKSFTGENVVELHCHGGVQIARAVLKRAIALGARLAERGEFTKRAFLNGKLSLSSAEGMADMINGESDAEVRAGFALYHETLTNRVKALQEQLTSLLAGMDCDIDYPEEDLEFASEEAVKNALEGISLDLEQLIAGYGTGRKIKQGVTVVLAGRPNAGKSSLLNALLGFDRAIVSEIPGTTRDLVDGSMEIEGVKFRLFDTAGLRKSDDAVEKIGVERAERLLKSADIILYLAESWTEEDSRLAAASPLKPVLVATKSDLNPPFEGAELSVSAKSGAGLSGLRSLLYERGVGEGADGAFLVEERHYSALLRARASIRSALENLGNVPSDLLTVDVKECWDALGEITGETASERVIEEIFAKFCVGK